MVYEPAEAPDVVMATSCEPMIAAAEGEMEEKTAGKQAELTALLADAMALLVPRS